MWRRPQARNRRTAKEPDPFVVLRQMCDYLKSLQQFSFHSEVTDDQVYLDGKKLQYGIDMETYVKRPDMFVSMPMGTGEQAVLFRRQDHHPV